MLSARLTVLTDQLHSLAPNLDGTAVTSQFDLRVWSRALQFDTPDRRSYVLNGLRYGFDICHSGILPSHECPNLKTTLGEKIAITEWVISGVQKGYIIGPLCHRPSGRFHVSPLGAVPKKNGKIRPIHHLSAPRGDVSINSQLSPEVSTVCYSRLLHLIRVVSSQGRNAYLWSVDAKDAYLRVPVLTSQAPLLGFRWQNRYFYFQCLPFGLSASCRIYTHFADAIMFSLVSHFPSLFTASGLRSSLWLLDHYLDDFTGVHASFTVATAQFQCALRWFEHLNVPTQPEKTASPTQQLVVLGWLFDTTSQTLSIPDDKRIQLVGLLDSFLSNTKVTQREIQSLVGRLRWVSYCIFGLQAFVRRLEQASLSVSRSTHHVRLRRGVCRDLALCRTLVIHAVGIPFSFLLKSPSSGDFNVWTDASTTVGLGGFACTGHWFQCRWQTLESVLPPTDILWQELCAVVVSCLLWGPSFSGQAVTVHCDNAAVVSIVSRKCAPLHREDLLQLVRLLCHLAFRFRFYFWIEFVEGSLNTCADALSRFLAHPLRHSPFQMRNAGDCCLSALRECVSLAYSSGSLPFFP
jgi:hypothetical protein